MRRPIIAGNWKMNNCIKDAVDLVGKLKTEVSSVREVDIVVAPVYTALSSVFTIIKGSTIALSAQDVYWESSGAYTGEVSPEMLVDVGCSYVIIGHSERRTYFGESDENVSKKINGALRVGLKPIVCIGETLEQRESGRTFDVIKTQLVNGLKGLTESQAENLVIAYEPVWAIGTGRNATSQQANEVHSFIRKEISGLFTLNVAENVRIQYGGSAKPDNAAQLMEQEDIDGLLVGGASLKADSFSSMIKLSIPR